MPDNAMKTLGSPRRELAVAKKNLLASTASRPMPNPNWALTVSLDPATVGSATGLALPGDGFIWQLDGQPFAIGNVVTVADCSTQVENRVAATGYIKQCVGEYDCILSAGS